VFSKVMKVSVNLLICLSFLIGCATGPTAPAQADINPLLWQATAPNGQTMYLFGSIEEADSSIYPMPAFVMDAFHQSDYLALEFDMFDPGAYAEQMQDLMFYRGAASVVDEIGEELFGRVSAILVDFGALEANPNRRFDRYTPVTLYSILTGHIMLAETSLNFGHGVDMFFRNEAGRSGMEVLELQSRRELLEQRQSVPVEFHIQAIERLIETVEQHGAEPIASHFTEMYSAWKAGDEQFFAAERSGVRYQNFGQIWNEYDEFMFTQPAVQMAESVMNFMDEGKNVFAVLDIRNLVGEGGVIDLLVQNGYDVVRVTRN